ncbi:MAG TPA: hypothetical protein VF910_03175 [Candidatus Bathyarchaeia archaeon]
MSRVNNQSRPIRRDEKGMIRLESDIPAVQWIRPVNIQANLNLMIRRNKWAVKRRPNRGAAHREYMVARHRISLWDRSKIFNTNRSGERIRMYRRNLGNGQQCYHREQGKYD